MASWFFVYFSFFFYMSLYQFVEGEGSGHIYGTENVNYTRDPSTHDYNITTRLPYNAQSSISIEEAFETNGHYYGTVPRDEEARIKYAEWIARSFRNLDVPRILDLIIDLPVGMRTSDRLSREIRQFPLGLLSALLKERILQRGFSISLYQQLFYSGRINRIINDPVSRATHTRTEVGNPEAPFRITTRVEKDISSMEDVYNFPIAKFELDIPGVAMDPTPQLAGSVASHLLVTPQAGERVTQFLSRVAYSDTGRLMSLNLYNYLNEVTRAAGGSDRSFFLFGENGHITKRFEVFHSRNNSISMRRARSIRTAGMRQVLLEDHFGEFQHRVVTQSMFTKYFVPGGIRNCFLASIRWAYVESCRDEVTTRNLENMESAQDSDMLTTSGSFEEFDEQASYLRIDTIIERVLNRRSKQKDSSDIRDYMKRYKNGFPTSELTQICALLYFEYGIDVFYWRIDQAGVFYNIANFSKDFVDPPPRKLILFQLDDQGRVMNVQKAKREIEEEVLATGLEDGSLGHMTHAISVYPPPPYFSSEPLNLNDRITRKRFVEALDIKTSAYIQSVYEKLNYDGDINYESLYRLVQFQLHRYRLKETKTLIFDLPSFSPHQPESKRLCFGARDDNISKKSSIIIEKMNEREYPRIWTFAYDLETVRNKADIQHLVYQPFRKEVPDIAFYDLQDCQIPFSFQYIGVNVDDTGNFFRRKINDGIKPLVYPCGHPLYECYLTEKPTTVYGEHFLLGECIEEALCQIANYVHGYQGEQVHLFAVNGSKFDSLITILYHRFEMTHILKTARGVLTVTLRVPIVKPSHENYDYATDPNPKVTIKLRDISLLVPGSLARLCKGFDVPKEYCKLDFPIQMVNATNCYEPRIREACGAYGENDVMALGWIIRKINELIGNSVWNPCEVRSDRPPITQFVTCMGMIRKSTKSHFDKNLPQSLQPKAIDIPALRTWLIQSAIGGRVTAYAKTYASKLTNDILRAAVEKNKVKLQELYVLMMEQKQCMQCLDVTSLYPFVMDSCPLPMGGLHSIDAPTCLRHIDMIHCDTCDEMRQLCPTHRYRYGTNDHNLRPFSIILVKNIKFEGSSRQNLCPRKSYSNSTGKSLGLLYSIEDNTEYKARLEDKETLNDVASYSNIDLYWMRRQGFTFEIIGGFSFSTLMIYNTFIGPAFQLRIEAKKAGNKLLSDFMKLNYNGSYGITIQQDINDSFFLAKIDKSLHNRDPRDPEVRNAIYRVSQCYQNREGLICSEELTGEASYFPNGQGCFQKRKKEHLAEYFSEQSPMQIGSAILSYARHVGNLILFNKDVHDYSYTDTDSFTIGESAIDSDPGLKAMIMNRDDAPLGSLKNDHAENNGTEPRIFLSLIGAKKVKGHFTLNKEGEVQIFNTFKGLHVSCDIDDKKINPAYADYITTKVLLDINIRNGSDPVIVQSWKRNLQHGVAISNHIQVLDTNTYFDDHMGVRTLERPHGFMEYFVPFGGDKIQDDFEFNKVITKEDGTKDYTRPRDIETFYDREILEKFISAYYEGCDQEYNPGTEEYKKILALFQ